MHGPHLLSHSQSVPDFNRIKPKKEADDSCQLDTNVGCLCGQTFLLGNFVKVAYINQQSFLNLYIKLLPCMCALLVTPSFFFCDLLLSV